jgi:SAM-dependent methyltransferase
MAPRQETTQQAAAAVDETAVKFTERIFAEAGTAISFAVACLGDRLGLFRVLAESGPATPRDLAMHAQINERYAQEWLAAMAAHGYLSYDAPTKRFTLPAAHAPALVKEAGPLFFGGVLQIFPALMRRYDDIAEAFRTGKGVALERYDNDFWEGEERFSAPWYENQLTQAWVPAIPALERRLQDPDSCIAEIGSGHGRALRTIARAYPTPEYHGFDVHGPSVRAANAAAKAAGLQARITFHEQDVSREIPGEHDVILAFDVIHDTGDPVGILENVRRALKPDGFMVLQELNVADTLEGNLNPVGALLYGSSVFFCLNSARGQGGEGLGAVFPEPKVRALAADAGFRTVEVAPVEDPLAKLYVLRP